MKVQTLKSENKKLNFKILVENEGGTGNIVRETLGSGPSKSHQKVTKNSTAHLNNLSNDVLLNETIKELKVKLKITEDSNTHLNNTVKNLNKKMNLLKKLSIGGSTTENNSKTNLKMRNLYLPTPPKTTNTLLSNSNLDFRSSNFSSAKSSKSALTESNNNSINKNENSNSKIHNQFQEILDEKETRILDLTRQNEIQRLKLEELTELVRSYEKGLSSPRFGLRKVDRNHNHNHKNEIILKSTASKVKLANRSRQNLADLGQLGPININRSNDTMTLALHTTNSGTTTATVLPPLKMGGVINHTVSHSNTTPSTGHSVSGTSLAGLDFQVQQNLEDGNGMHGAYTNQNAMPLPKGKTRIEINKINQQRLEEAEGGMSYKNLRKNYDLDRGEENFGQFE